MNVWNYVPLKRVISNLCFDIETKNKNVEIKKFSKHIKDADSEVFIWQTQVNGESLHVSNLFSQYLDVHFKDTDNLFVVEEFLYNISYFDLKLLEDNKTVTRIIIIYEDYGNTHIAKFQLNIVGTLNTATNMIFGIFEIISLSNESNLKLQKITQYIHDIKNSMTTMLSIANRINKKTKNNNLKNQANYIKDIIYDCNYLLSLMKKENYPTKACSQINLHQIIEFLVDSFKCERKIKFIKKLKATETMIFADKVLITSALNNLIINAIQAEKHKGRITIKTYNKKEDKNSTFNNAGYIFIEIKDNGMDICKKDMDKIFNRDYTTKIMGEGIGLNSAKATIIQYNGSITATLNKGRGLTILVCLPMC